MMELIIIDSEFGEVEFLKKSKEKFLDSIYDGEVSEDDIIKYTKALRIPKKVLVD